MTSIKYGQQSMLVMHHSLLCTVTVFFSPKDVVIKTLISIHPILKHNYRSFFYNHTRGSACFEILGFDVLLDRKLKAWLVEVGIIRAVKNTFLCFHR